MSECSINDFKFRVRVFVVLLLMAVIGILLWHIHSERHAILTAARLQSQGYARALSEHAGSAFAEADRVLRDVVLEINDLGGIDRIGPGSVFHIIRRQGGDTPQIGALFIVNRAGIMTVNSLEFPSKQINVADREYFQFNVKTPGAGLFISRPLISRLVNRWRFTMTRPLSGLDGKFAGLAAVAFEIDFFDRFYTSLGLGPRSTMQILRGDGAPLVNEPYSAAAYDPSFIEKELLDNLPSARSGTIPDFAEKEGATPSIVSFYRLSRFPIVAVVSLHQADLLKPWERKMAYQAGITAGLCITVLFLMQMLFRHLDKLQLTQQSLREQQELVKVKAAQIDAATDAILLVNTDGTLAHFNNALCLMTGYSQEELQGIRLHELEPPEFAAAIPANIKMIKENGEGIFDSAFLTRSGSVLPVEVHARLMECEGQTCILSIVRDITERKRAELRERTRLGLLEQIATGVELGALLHSIVEFVEQEQPVSLCSILLVDESGTHLRLGAAPSLPAFYNAAVNGIRIAEGIGSCGTAAHRRQRVIVEDIVGHRFWKGFKPATEAGLRSCWSEPVVSSQGKILGTFAVYHRHPCTPDLAEIQLIESAAHLASIAIERVFSEEQKIRLEAQLHHVQKIEAVGQLAGGIAHDFNNLLTPIIGYAHLVQTKLPEQDPLQERVSGIISAALKARDLTQQMLSFGRKQRMEMKAVDLNETILNFRDILQRTIRENIAIKVNLSAGGIVIWADRGQIEQILLNLAVNAQDAIRGNGGITIETGHVVLDDEYARLHPGMHPGSYALLAFGDTGCGMSNDILSHIFEPFYTTKQIGHGTGLGLATVYGIIKQHEGYITVRSREGHGTVFSMYLPLTDKSVVPEQPVSPQQAISSAADHRTILVVEDNEMVRVMTVDLLESAGYEVLSAPSPSAAIELATQHGERIALMVSDVIMPEMSGVELYGKLVETLPRLRILYISGYTNEQFVHNGTLEEGVNFMQKPFSSEKLISEVRRVAGEV